AGGRLVALEAIEVEVGGTAGEDGGAQGGQRVVAQQRLAARQQVGRPHAPAGQLLGELVGGHREAVVRRSDSASCTRVASSCESRRSASSRFLRSTSTSALARYSSQSRSTLRSMSTAVPSGRRAESSTDSSTSYSSASSTDEKLRERVTSGRTRPERTRSAPAG